MDHNLEDTFVDLIGGSRQLVKKEVVRLRLLKVEIDVVLGNLFENLSLILCLWSREKL